MLAECGLGYDINGVKPSAFGLPELNAFARPSAGATPYRGTDDELSAFSRVRLVLDTGNQTSSISKAVAESLGVRFQDGTEGTSTPVLESTDPDNPAAPGAVLANQFTSVVQGIGGQETIVGFYLDSMQLKTRQGNANDDNDPNHINFVTAPVYIQDVTLQDPLTMETYTIAGIIGMNYLMASFEGALPLFLTAGPFETLVLNFDQNHANANTLGLYAADFTPVPPPAALKIPLPLGMLLTVIAIFLVSGLFALGGNRVRPARHR